MNEEKHQPDAIDRFVLEFAGTDRWGVIGWPRDDLLNEALRRGIQSKAVVASIKILQADGCIEPRQTPSGSLVVITTAGRARLRQLRATTQFNIRLPNEVRDNLAPYVGRIGDSASSVAVTALTEWERMMRFPGIDFRWTPSGRKPHVTGTGLSVWELYRLWLDHGHDRRMLAKNYPDLKPAQIESAVAYAEANVHEMPSDDFGKCPPHAQRVEV